MPVSLLLALAIIRPSQPTPNCTPPDPASAIVSRALIAAVNTGRSSAIDSFARGSWDGADTSTALRAAVMTRLGVMHWQSRNWRIQDGPCAVNERLAYLLVANTLSDEVDSVIVRFGPGGRVAGVTNRSGVRVAIRRADTVSDAARFRALRQYIARFREAGVFSGVVALERNDRLIFVDTGGLANRATGSPITLNSRFNLASLNKIFTATAVMQLVASGTLSLDDSLAKFYPDTGIGRPLRVVTIRQLLSHTSGIRSTTDSLSSAPGTVFSYSNLGFNLLGEILERVSGERYEDYLAEHVFRPAGMHWTGRYVLTKPVAYLAMGYVPIFDSAGLRLDPNPLLHIWAGNSAGGLFSNAPDLFRFASALRSGKLLPTSFVQEMRTSKHQGDAFPYGFGVLLWRGPGIWGHAGDLPGTTTDLEVIEPANIVSVILANQSDANAPIRRRIAYLWGIAAH